MEEMQARYTGDMGVHNPVEHLAHELGDPLLVHLPHVAVALRVGHLKVLELGLQVLELLGDALVLLRELLVLVLEAALLARVARLEVGEDVGHPRQLLFLLLFWLPILPILHELSLHRVDQLPSSIHLH